MDNGEVTIMANDGSFVGLGILTQEGRNYYHIRIIPDAMQGGTEPTANPERFDMDDVTILRGYQWQILLDHHNKIAQVLAWHAKRTEAVEVITADLTREIQDRIDCQVDAWETTHPKPHSGRNVAKVEELPVIEPDPEPSESPQDNESQDTESEEHSNNGMEEPEDPVVSQDEWDQRCHSLKDGWECVLPADHDEMHSNSTSSDTDGYPPTWSDEEQTGEMPF